ncbi:MAG: chaperone modulator CbpM [Alphaproteobacteria bacterium]
MTKADADEAVLDDEIELTLDQLTYFCAPRHEHISTLVEEGVLQPQGGSQAEWRFSGRVLHRAAKAVRLQRDLDVNAHAIALIMDLLDEIESLRSRLQR